MTDIERGLRAAMHAAVDGESPPADLIPAVLRRHRRYLVRVTCVAAAGAIVVAAVPVALASSGVLGGGHGRYVPRGSRTPAPLRSSSPQAPHRSRAATAPHSRREPAWMRGLPMPPSEGLRLLVTARDPVWFSSPADASRPIAGLPHSAFPYTFTRVSGGWAALPSPACRCRSPRVPVYYVADGSAVARRVGVAQTASPASGVGTMWLQSHVKGTANGTTARQVASTGRPIGPAVLLPSGSTILQGVGSYLLLTPDQQDAASVIYRLWNPRTRQVIRRFPNVLAASGGQVAWGICAGCPLHVLNLRSGVTTTARIPARNWAYDGMFSPDGRFLAVHVSGGVRPDGYSTLARIGVIDLRTGRLRILAGSSLGTDARAALIFGWQGGTDTLIAAVTGHQVTQVATWHPGAAHLLVRKFWLPPDMTVVLGPYG